MRSVSVRLVDLEKATIPIGFVGENEHTKVQIDCKKVFDDYPTAVPTMAVEPPEGDPYPAMLVRDGDIVIWTITDSDLIYSGSGKIQLSFVKDEIVAKTFIARTRIYPSILPIGDIPAPIEDWLTRADAALDGIPQAIDDALQEAKDSGEFDGFSPTVAITTVVGGHRVTITDADGEHSADILDGEKGDKGDKGDDGYSPKVSVSSIPNGNKVYIQDATSIKSFNVYNGAQGTPGLPGLPGEDGYSPSASVSKVGKVATVTITDKDGTTTASVSDGADADPTELIDDETPALDKTFSSSKLDGDLGDLKREINVLEPAATASDIGKALVVKTVADGKPTSFEYGEAGGDVSGKADIIITNATGRIAHIEDGAAYNAESVICHINPVQAGYGDPSSSNIRAISGHTGINITRAGENLIDEDGVFSEYFTKNPDGGWDYAKTTYANVYGTKVYEHTGTERLAVTYKCKYTNASKTGLFLKIYYTNGTSENVLSGSTVISNASKTVDYISWTYSSNTSTVNTKEIIIQIEKYATISVATVSWQTEAGTVYGGTINPVTGELSVTHGYIASYGGETLPSTWISDRDVYAEGTTPTTGAQVVYKLSTPEAYTLTGQQISLLFGENNIWNDVNGETDVTYKADTKLYISRNSDTNIISMYVTPEMFGAKGDGATDDRAAIIDAMEEAYKTSKTVLFQNQYYSSAPIVVEDVPDIEMNGTIKFNSSGNGLTLGKSSASTVEKRIRINVSCDPQATGSAYFGFKMLNAINCSIEIESIKGFCYGFIIAGDTRGCAYNTVSINTISSVDKSLIMARTDENSFNSENLFIGGRYVQSGNNDVAIEIQGSNNVFIAPCMEYALHSLVFINANKNRVISCRTEHSTYAAKFEGTCDFNDVEVGYGAYAVDGFSNLSIVRYNEGTSMDAVGTTVASAYNNTVYDAGYLASKVTIDNAISLEEPLWSLTSNTGDLYRDGISSSYFAKAGNELQITGGCIGVVVDCTLTKELGIYQNGSGAGKVIVKLYDDNGDAIDMSEINIGPFTDYRDYFGGIITYGNLPFSKILLPPEAKSAYIGFMAITGTSLLTFAVRSRTMTIVIP